jgi:hypothetical protein
MARIKDLYNAVNNRQLTRQFLERLLQARERDLIVQQPVMEPEILEHVDAIQSSLV